MQAQLLIEGETKDLGGFTVRRTLPSANRQMVGPFIFFDHFGPADFGPGEGIDVRPHPHIGLATVTYTFDGEIMHRDSLGYVQAIQPGAVNLMTAGRGIVHSERSGEAERARRSKLHGIQTWMAMPTDQQEADPAFAHYPADALPRVSLNGADVTVIVGRAFAQESPVSVPAQTLYMDVQMHPSASLSLAKSYDELALYVVEGEVQVDESRVAAGSMLVLDHGCEILSGSATSRLMVIGGETMGRRQIWWNFVSTSAERIEQAKRDWREGRFETVPNDPEFIPLPDK